MREADLERVHEDLIAWHVLEPDAPPRFTTRFRAALARAALRLQSEAGDHVAAAEALDRQVHAALHEFVDEKGEEVGAEHQTFVRALHVTTLPAAIRQHLGL